MNREHSPYRLAEELEHALGDPADARTPFSYAACLDLDAREEFPAGICGSWTTGACPTTTCRYATAGGSGTTSTRCISSVRWRGAI